MIRTKSYFGMVVIAAALAAQGNTAELQRETAEAWQEYLCRPGNSMQARLEGSEPFLWMDEEAGRARRVKSGEIVVAPLAGHGTQSVPNGLIHDWIGAVFIPNATVQSLLEVVRHYDRYKDFYKPVVMDSQVLDADGAEQEFSMVWQRHVLFVNAAMRGHYHAKDVIVDAYRGYSIVEARTLQQIDDYGQPGEHLLPPDTGSGFIWRIYSIARYAERDGGVYLEVEGIALSRGVPRSMRWLVNPVVNHLSVNSLTTTLEQTRAAVNRQKAAPERLVAKESKGRN